jgi:hypothetical protein
MILLVIDTSVTMQYNTETFNRSTMFSSYFAVLLSDYLSGLTSVLPKSMYDADVKYDLVH